MRYNDLLLFLFQKVENERSTNSIFHLLRGKKSSQTLQDAYLFQIENFYGIDRKLSKVRFDKQVIELKNQSFIDIENDQVFLTASGRTRVNQMSNNRYFLLKGHLYHRIDLEFKESLFLLAHSISMLVHKKNRFIPIVDRPFIQHQIKELLKAYHKRFDRLSKQLFKELNQSLSEMHDDHALIFMLQFSGSHRIGLSKQQVANEMNLTPEDIHLQTLTVIHQLMEKANDSQAAYPLLSQLILQKSSRLTESAERTFQLYQNGYTIDQICMQRSLKQSTIQDHFVEIATQHHHFDMEPFLPNEQLDEILQTIDQSGTKKLKAIKQVLHEDISYFQIRLAIAKMNQREKV